MLTLFAIALLTVLFYRLGWFEPYVAFKERALFRNEVLALADETDWEEGMARQRAAHWQAKPYPRLRMR